MDNQDSSFVHGAENINRRVERLEEGRRENALLAQSAANAVVDLKEDIHELKNDIKEIKGLVEMAIREASEAARQGKITNGSVADLKEWRITHTKEVEPIVRQAKDAFLQLNSMQLWVDKEKQNQANNTMIKKVARDIGGNSWKVLLALLGGILLGAEVWQYLEDLWQ